MISIGQEELEQIIDRAIVDRYVKLDRSNFKNLHLYNDISNNPITDLSVLQKLPSLHKAYFNGVDLPRKYWTKLSDWEAEWLLDEDNSEIRSLLVERLGYQRICEELNAITIDTWREYNLLVIDGVLEDVYIDYGAPIGLEPVGTEPIVLLKMICPSTRRIHILRVPPEMMSAEAAITWVNHGIHPDEFAVQT